MALALSHTQKVPEDYSGVAGKGRRQQDKVPTGCAPDPRAQPPHAPPAVGRFVLRGPKPQGTVTSQVGGPFLPPGGQTAAGAQGTREPRPCLSPPQGRPADQPRPGRVARGPRRHRVRAEHSVSTGRERGSPGRVPSPPDPSSCCPVASVSATPPVRPCSWGEGAASGGGDERDPLLWCREQATPEGDAFPATAVSGRSHLRTRTHMASGRVISATRPTRERPSPRGPAHAAPRGPGASQTGGPDAPHPRDGVGGAWVLPPAQPDSRSALPRVDSERSDSVSPHRSSAFRSHLWAVNFQGGGPTQEAPRKEESGLLPRVQMPSPTRTSGTHSARFQEAGTSTSP